MFYPIIKDPAHYAGQFGVPWSGSELGIRLAPRGVVIYVDNLHPNASDNADGTDPNSPKVTIQSAVNSNILTSGSVIQISPGDYSESVVTPTYIVGPNYVTIRGASNGRYTPYWASGAAASPCLDMRAVGWRVEGFRFAGPVQSACIILRHVDSGANDIAIRTVIQDCLFDGLTIGRYGIWSHGCYDVWIVNNTFQLFHNAVGGGAIPLWANTTPVAIPYRNHILNNIFWDNDNGMVFPCNGCEIRGNVFQPVGYAYAMTQVLNTSVGGNPGDDNLVIGNYFPGDYSIAGGYNPGAADVWLGNFADDVAEPEIADNGITISRPT